MPILELAFKRGFASFERDVIVVRQNVPFTKAFERRSER
jgi:hypothetical protein